MRQQPFASPSDALKSFEARDRRIEQGKEFLEHYGVKGMKWGVRKEQDTNPRDGQTGVDPISAAIGAFYIGVFLLAAYATVRDIRAQVKDSGKHIQKQNANVAWKKKPELAQKAPPMNVDKLFTSVVKPVNPNYPKPGTKMNCRRATFAYEMRRRGYDVQATPSHFATGQDAHGLHRATMTTAMKRESIWGHREVAPMHTFIRETPQRRSELIFDSLNQYPNGARGELGVGWKFGGGHSMAFEKVNGKIVIFDTQSSKIYRDPASFSEFANVTHAAAHTRTDNIKLDEQFLRRWMVNN